MKPYLVCHMVTTIDGRIMPARWGTLPGPKSAANLFETTAASYGIGAWIVGTTTMLQFCAKPFKLKPVSAGARSALRRDHIAKPDAKRFAIGVDRRGRTFWRSDEVDGDHVVLLLSDRVSDAYLAHLRAAGVSYFLCGKTDVNLRVALDKLSRAFRLKKAMVQGGGAMNGSFLNEGLLDEISHLIVPVADGGRDIQTLFDIPGRAPKKSAAKLRVISHRMLGGGVSWTKYRVM